MWDEFTDGDAEYLRWLEGHPNGFVVNTRRRGEPHYAVLHRASCTHISRPSHELEPDGFTEREYIKICADNVGPLREWVRANRRPDGTFSSECSTCNPTV